MAENWPKFFTLILPSFLFAFVLSNFYEEIGWTGFLLDRVQDRYQPLKAAAIVTVPFSLLWAATGALRHLGDVYAPCSAWLDLGLADSCEDPDEVTSLFASSVNMPFYGDGFTEGEQQPFDPYLFPEPITRGATTG